MAQKVVVSLVDDLDGGEADESLEFGLDGATYEIDLSDANAAKLRDSFADYVAHARRTSGVRRQGRKNNGVAVSTPARPAAAQANSKVPATRDREQTQAIRDWARKNGAVVSERGRIPARVEEAYAKKDPSLLTPAEAAEPATNGHASEVATTLFEDASEAPTSTETAGPDMSALPDTPRELTRDQKRVIAEWALKQGINDDAKLTRVTADLLGNYKATVARGELVDA